MSGLGGMGGFKCTKSVKKVKKKVVPKRIRQRRAKKIARVWSEEVGRFRLEFEDQDCLLDPRPNRPVADLLISMTNLIRKI